MSESLCKCGAWVDDADIPTHPCCGVVGGYDALWGWFGLSRASWLTIPRVLMHAMPDEWQGKMAALLHEYAATFPNQPDLGTRVQCTDLSGKLCATPNWLVNYRHPQKDVIDTLRGEPK